MEPRELLKKLHPNQFSDSKIIDKIDCPRELLDFFLSRLPEENKHFEFEEFARKILENEVCPNLIEETGPAGGGDGKVDTENYPVSTDIQKFWWYGLNGNNEKWAFAFSLKKDWKSKCNSDIEKIINTQRGYTKIYFVTNQSIKNDKRLEYQDEKKNETGLEIIIFDKTWILDKTLNSKNIELIKILNITQPLQETQIGPNDFKKKNRIEEIEKMLNDYATKKILNQDVIDLSIESAILSRDLEESEIIVSGKFNRALGLAKEKKNYVAQKKILYDLAWYYNRWINDDDNFDKQYKEYQDEVCKDKNIDEILELANLWTIAFTRKNRNKEALKEETELILTLLSEKEDSKSIVTQLKAKTRLCFIKILLEEDIDNQFQSLIDIVKEAIKYKEYDFIVVAKSIESLLPVFNDNKLFVQLYDLITDNLTTRNGDTQRAKMYLNRAKLLSKDNKHYEAINLLGKCLTLLYKEETSGKLIETYVNIAANFDAIGLTYAAKNYYISALTMFIDLFFKENDLEPISIKVIDRIIELELISGNVEMVIKWVYIRNVLINILVEKNIEYNQEDEEETIFEIDTVLATMILKTKFEDLKKMDKIIFSCAKNGLITSEVMAKYVLGEYDETIIKECSGDKEKADGLIIDLFKEAQKKQFPEPKYDNEKNEIIISKICGNNIKINFKATNLSHRFAEFLLALLENSFATVHSHRAYMRGDIIINLQEKNSGTFNVEYSFDGLDNYTIILDSIDMYDLSVENHTAINDVLFKILANIFAVNFIYDDYEETFKEIFEDEKTFERSLNHTNSLYNISKIFGPEDDDEIPTHNITRDKEWYYGLELEIPESETIEPFKEKKTVEYNFSNTDVFSNISHKDIYSSGIINVTHWNIAKWDGMMYSGSLQDYSWIKIGFVFKNEDGAKKVFQDLIDCVGKKDIDENIVLSFIKGINKDRIYDYRVMITGKVKVPKSNGRNIMIKMLTRFHEMKCENEKNISILENIIKNGTNPEIIILPMIKDENKRIIKPLLDYEILLKNINIKQAYEIGKEDYEATAILKTDKPVIPKDIKDAPINELLELKKKYE